MDRLRVLVTNLRLDGRSGTELYVRDLTLGLLRRGVGVAVYTPHPGELAAELRAATAPVVDRLEALGAAPDVIHGHHTHQTLAAMSRFPSTPALLFCHDWDAWHDEPIDHPRVRRYVAVDEACQDRLLASGVAPERVEVAPNWVDVERFRPRGPLPARPARALVYNNLARLGGRRDPFRAGCAALGIEVESAGARSGRSLAAPERVLGGYDVVFAKGKSALEAIACGAAVVVASPERLGPLVTPDRFDTLRRQNFGRRALEAPATAGGVSERLAGYDPAAAAEVTRRLRAEAGLDGAVDRLVALYRAVVSEHRADPSNPLDEARAVARYLERTHPLLECGAGRWRRQTQRRQLADAAATPWRRVRALWRRAA